MKEIVELINTPVFWFSSIAVALVVNLAATLIANITGKIFTRLRSSEKSLNEIEKERVVELSKNKELLYIESLGFLRKRTHTIELFAFAAGLWFLTLAFNPEETKTILQALKLVATLCASAIWLIAIRQLLSNMKSSRVLEEVEIKIKNKN